MKEERNWWKVGYLQSQIIPPLKVINYSEKSNFMVAKTDRYHLHQVLTVNITKNGYSR